MKLREARIGVSGVRAVIALGLTTGVAMATVNEAQAGGSRPAAVCKPMSGLPGGLWLGHFTGGRRLTGAVGRTIEWRDDYACFQTASACQRWRRDLARVYRHVEGWGTCMALRGGGRPLRAVRQVGIRVRY